MARPLQTIAYTAGFLAQAKADGLPVYLVAMLAKGARANFSDMEVAAMATFAKRIVTATKGARP